MENKFWNIINQAKSKAESYEERPEELKKILLSLSSEEVAEFDKVYQQKLAKAYRWDLWGAAYLINGGCSDDGFHYFCAFLISEGEEVYTKALENPESLVDVEIEEDADLEEFNYVASEVYEAQTGKDIPSNDIAFPEDPIGKEWDEDELDKIFPKLSEKYA